MRNIYSLTSAFALSIALSASTLHAEVAPPPIDVQMTPDMGSAKAVESPEDLNIEGMVTEASGEIPLGAPPESSDLIQAMEDVIFASQTLADRLEPHQNNPQFKDINEGFSKITLAFENTLKGIRGLAEVILEGTFDPNSDADKDLQIAAENIVGAHKDFMEVEQELQSAPPLSAEYGELTVESLKLISEILRSFKDLGGAFSDATMGDNSPMIQALNEVGDELSEQVVLIMAAIHALSDDVLAINSGDNDLRKAAETVNDKTGKLILSLGGEES